MQKSSICKLPIERLNTSASLYRIAPCLSAIQQERGESVEQFVFKYKKLLHQLEKFGEKIAKDCPTFVIHSLFLKSVLILLSSSL